jgi:hypothetical protein
VDEVHKDRFPDVLVAARGGEASIQRRRENDMAIYRLPANTQYNFAAGTIAGNANVANTNNVAGNLQYQIGAAPMVNFPLVVNQDDFALPVNGVALFVANQSLGTITINY